MSEQENSDETEHPDGLPKPRDDPTIKYCHEGKQYKLLGRHDRIIEIVHFDPDGPAGGIVVVDFVDTDDQPPHEHERTDAGATKAALEEYIEEHGEKGGVITVNRLQKDIGELKIGEVDPWSYHELYEEGFEGS